MNTIRLLCVAATLLLGSTLQVRAADRVVRAPHLVLFVADDYTWNDCGAYGAKDVRTPNLDRLAREGMRFDAAFAASPTCTPSRSALYTRGSTPSAAAPTPTTAWCGTSCARSRTR